MDRPIESNPSTDNESIRIFICDIIQNAGILLRLPQVAMTTAQMLIQRVYQTPDYVANRYHLDITAMAALFQAAKIEECRREARNVIDVFTHVISMKLGKELTLSYRNYEKVREKLVTAERRLLRTLGYKSLISIHPHKIIVIYYRNIVYYLDPEHNVWTDRENRRLLQRAWNYCNDSLRIDVNLRYKKEVVACACIQMACEDIPMLFPTSTDGKEWYCLYVDNESDVRDAIEMIRKFYQRARIEPKDLKRYMLLYEL